MFLQANHFASVGLAPLFALRRFYGVSKVVGDGDFFPLVFLRETLAVWAASGMIKRLKR